MVNKNVSIVVPVYNSENTIKNCLESLLALDYPHKNLEIIVVNNNSTDSTLSILNEYKDRIKILEERKKGPSAARNAGIKKAKGEIIAFTDADCVVDKNWVKYIIAPFTQSNNELIGIVAGKIKTLNPVNAITLSGDLIHDHKKALNYDVPYAISMNWASRKKVLFDVGMFDEEFIRGQDSELSLRIYRAGYMLVYNQEALIYHKNPETFRALFHKGYLSGRYSRRKIRKHSEFISKIDKKNKIIKLTSILISIFRILIVNKNFMNFICLSVYHSGRFLGMYITRD